MPAAVAGPTLLQFLLLKGRTSPRRQHTLARQRRRPIRSRSKNELLLKLVVEQQIALQALQLECLEILHRLNAFSRPQPPCLQPGLLGLLHPGQQRFRV